MEKDLGKGNKAGKEKKRKPLFVDEKKKIECLKQIKKKRASFYRKYHNISGKARPISRHLDDPELSGDPNMESYIDDFDVNKYL